MHKNFVKSSFMQLYEAHLYVLPFFDMCGLEDA